MYNVLKYYILGTIAKLYKQKKKKKNSFNHCEKERQVIKNKF